MKIIFLAILVGSFGFTRTPNLNKSKIIDQENYDLVILANLLHDNLNKTNGREFTLTDLKKVDTLNRISDNFNWIEMKSKGGYISVAFRYNKERKTNIELNKKELENLKYINLIKKRKQSQNDGEIRLEYPERFYRIKKIIVFVNGKS